MKIRKESLETEDSKMLNWLKNLSITHALGWIGVGLLALVLVLVFVRRLIGMVG